MAKVHFGNDLDGILDGQPKRGAVLITPGAGGTMDTPLLVRTAERLNELGFLTLRWNFGYVKARRAPSAGGKREIPEMEAALDYLTTKAKGVPLITVGKSFGARLSTYIAIQRSDIAGFVFYGLPLHGMAKNAKMRDWSHLSHLKGKVLFITGDKDKLCSLEHLQEVQKFLKIKFKSEVVPGDHSFKPRGEDMALDICIDWMDKSFKT
jgi:predicted alpha/beta-hydrolase family hydrolase